MNAITEAVAVIRNAEIQIRDILQRLVADGDYDSLQLVARWAGQLQEMIRHADSLATDGREQTCTLGTTTVQAADRFEHPPFRRPERAKNSATPYPKFIRLRDELVKIGWSRKRKREYCHKVPKRVVLLVAQRLEEKRATSELFPFEEVLPIVDPQTGTEVPGYQAYAALAWFRKEGLVIQQGRQGYSLLQNIKLIDAVEQRWGELPAKP
jgi:hypothetical protein